ncbi:hypothetical protein O3Q52_36175 [Streptomyces sp. ActVer]|uniref:hypothetical protein n=1 Tax=Streptomyces sp. ActVer TaxID=3014558 RepID=UPI0022B5B185|nr:hypothetical protein [Streptomyces sp. ActVer]MCZ4513492.1 hypothetical protein [Streptomyces sp. ActVer]
MPDRSSQPPDQPSPRTAAQRLATQILARTADHLTNIGPKPMADSWRTAALNTAMNDVLDPVESKYQRSAARRAVLMALPPITGTTVEYAARVRELAVAA